MKGSGHSGLYTSPTRIASVPITPVSMNAYVPDAVAALRPVTRSSIALLPGASFSSSITPRMSAFRPVVAAIVFALASELRRRCCTARRRKPATSTIAVEIVQQIEAGPADPSR